MDEDTLRAQIIEDAKRVAERFVFREVERVRVVPSLYFYAEHWRGHRLTGGTAYLYGFGPSYYSMGRLLTYPED